MDGFYTEQLIRKRKSVKDLMIEVLLLAVTIVSAAVVFIHFVGIILLIVMIIIDVFVFRALDIEYEYLYLDGDLEIDKIVHKERRKRLFSVNAADVKLLAPSGSDRLNAFKNADVRDYTSGNPNAEVYEMVVVFSEETKRIVFEPNETILKGMKTLVPQKVVCKQNIESHRSI
ncbi:DUF6106 family protein [Dorea acetigenes]|uniref:DUF6106 family protein n=1 Tax=Dorea acetigenes TaxID=2981787 RepID=A0ABT2RK58_9FIRM|nr:DUF6106 family protein [Dorea acetigenes]MCU6685755.1 DUF6106 family protein [Dorea acetigenes]SCI61852.1 Uncharacterised protein [uncultured Clostridium sp.]